MKGHIATFYMVGTALRGLFKIGYTMQTVEQRFSTLATSVPFHTFIDTSSRPLNLIAFQPFPARGALDVERYAHRRLEAYRVRGEWFLLEKRETEWMREFLLDSDRQYLIARLGYECREGGS